MMPQRTQYLGVLGQEHCFSAEAAAETAAPQDGVGKGCGRCSVCWMKSGLRSRAGVADRRLGPHAPVLRRVRKGNGGADRRAQPPIARVAGWWRIRGLRLR